MNAALFGKTIEVRSDTAEARSFRREMMLRPEDCLLATFVRVEEEHARLLVHVDTSENFADEILVWHPWMTEAVWKEFGSQENSVE